jgi:hypothetical protein
MGDGDRTETRWTRRRNHPLLADNSYRQTGSQDLQIECNHSDNCILQPDRLATVALAKVA